MVILNGGKRINIEMQNRYQEDWTERSVFYNCRMFVEGFSHGKSYGELEPCIHVGILDFRQMKSPGFHHLVRLKEENTGEVYCSKFAFHVIELKKLEEASETEKEDEQELYRWARLDDLKRAVEDAIFREALYKEYGLRDERS